MLLKERGKYEARNGKQITIIRFNAQKNHWIGEIDGDTNNWNEDGTDADDYKPYDIVKELISEVTPPINLIVSIQELIQKWSRKGQL